MHWVLYLTALTIVAVPIKCSLPCLTWELKEGFLSLTCQLMNLSSTVYFYDNSGKIRAQCNFISPCNNIYFNDVTNKVTLTFEMKTINSIDGEWSCVQGNNTYTSNVTKLTDHVKVSNLAITGAIRNSTSPAKKYIQITCISCQRSYSNAMEFLVNGRTIDTVHYFPSSDTCIHRNGECSSSDTCSCSLYGHRFSRVFEIRSYDNKISIACLVSLKDEKGLLHRTSTIQFDGNEFTQMGSKDILDNKPIHPTDNNDFHHEGLEIAISLTVVVVTAVLALVAVILRKLIQIKQKRATYRSLPGIEMKQEDTSLVETEIKQIVETGLVKDNITKNVKGEATMPVETVQVKDTMTKIVEEDTKMQVAVPKDSDVSRKLKVAVPKDNYIPKEIKEKYNIYIEEWLKNDETFTVTRATQYVTNFIKKNDVVLVAGTSGAGKSSIIHHVALELQNNEGYEVIPFVISPEDILNYRDITKNQVFVIDDICGKNAVDENDLRSWKANAHKIGLLFFSERTYGQGLEKVKGKENNGITKILVSCNYPILKNEHFKSLNLFTKGIIDLDSKEHCLLPKERQQMIQKYTALSDIDFTKLNDVSDEHLFFPMLCRMSKGKQVEQLIELFSSPIECLKNDIKRMIKYSHFEYCALVLCVLYHNRFDKAYMAVETRPLHVKQRLTEIVTNFKINIDVVTKRERLFEAFEQLDGTFIKKAGRVYSISHDMLNNLIVATLWHQLKEPFIKCAPTSLITHGFRFRSIFQDQDDNVFLYLSEDIENLYFERVLSDLRETDGTSLFYNQQLSEKKYKFKLIEYIKHNSADFTQIFLDLDMTGVQISQAYNEYRSTPMIEASKIGFDELVFYLISIKCDLNKKDFNGCSPLYYSCKYDFMYIVELLLSHMPEIVDVLYDACKYGHTSIVKLLLDRYVDVPQYGRSGYTLLCVACREGCVDIVKLLLERKFDVSQCSKSGDTPLCIACEEGHINIVKLLLDSNVDLSQSGRSGNTPLCVACNEGHTEIVKLLLDSKVDVSKCGSSGDTPLYIACREGHTDTVKMILDRYADVSQCGESGDTPLCVACNEGHNDIVKLLLDSKVDVSKCGRSGDTPLYIACREGRTDIVKIILDSNADVSQCCKSGDTPLCVACEMGRTDIVKLLLDRNADVSQCGRSGDTPLCVACEEGRTDIVKLLLDRNIDMSYCRPYRDTPLCGASRHGRTEIMKLLLDRNADASQWGRFGDTPLSAACREGRTDIVKLLLDRNVDTSRCGRLKDTPLCVACRKGRIDVVKLLLDRNADASQWGMSGDTPLCVACKEGRTDIVKLLLDRKVDFSQSGSSGDSPLYISCYRGNTDIVELLLARNADMLQKGKRGLRPLDVAANETIRNLIKSYME